MFPESISQASSCFSDVNFVTGTTFDKVYHVVACTGVLGIIRELKQTSTAAATGTSLNKRFNEQNNGSARALQLLVHFVAVLCKTTT